MIRCVETNVMFLSISQASREMNITRQAISMCINKKRQSANSYHFEKVLNETKTDLHETVDISTVSCNTNESVSCNTNESVKEYCVESQNNIYRDICYQMLEDYKHKKEIMQKLKIEYIQMKKQLKMMQQLENENKQLSEQLDEFRNSTEYKEYERRRSIETWNIDKKLNHEDWFDEFELPKPQREKIHIEDERLEDW